MVHIVDQLSTPTGFAERVLVIDADLRLPNVGPSLGFAGDGGVFTYGDAAFAGSMGATRLNAPIVGGAAIEGPWDGEEAITLLADLDAGATGAMTGGGFPDGIRTIVDAHAAGRREDAVAAYARWLPLINFENRQGGILTAKALMKAGGVIACDAPRHPFAAMHPAVREGLLDTARRLQPLVLNWAR